MAQLSDCKGQIVKIADNNVEVQYYLLNPNDLTKVIQTQFTESYGQQRITDDRVTADNNWSFWDGLTSEDIANQITTALEGVAFYNNLQTAMNAPDGTIIELD